MGSIGLTDFWSGFITGFVVAICIGLIFLSLWNIIQGYIDKIKAADKPQIVIHTTNRTPNDVVDAASRAQRNLILTIVVLWVVLVLVLEYFRPGTIEDVISMFST